MLASSEYPQIPLNCRSKRYAVAEESLKTSFEQCASSEPAPRELQIRTLKRAAEMLASRAQDGQNRIEHLRRKLSDRQMDPTAYSSLQQERWREEKRQSAIQDDVEVLQRQLKSLADTTPPGIATLGSDADRRRRANLARFLETSLPSSRVVPKSRRDTLSGMPKRISTHDDSPPRLRPLSLITKRPHSVDDHPRAVAIEPSRTHHGGRHSPRTTLLSPIIESASTSFLPSPSLSSPPTSHESSPRTLSSDFSPKAPWFPLDHGEGTATIYRERVPIPFENQAMFDDLHVDIPDYARNLFDEFDTCIAPQSLSPSLPHQQSHPNVSPSVEPPPTPLISSATTSPDLGFIPGPANSKLPHSPLRKRPSQRSSLFSISEAISSRISFVSDHLHHSFSPKPSLSSLKSPRLETVGEVEGQDDGALYTDSAQPRVSLATRIKRRVLVRNGR